MYNFYMNPKFNLSQIAEDEWEVGDFRPVADIHKAIDELFEKYEVNFSEHFDEGLGCKYKIAFFQTPSNKRFFVMEYHNIPTPYTTVFVLFDPKTITQDLNEIKSLLDLDGDDLKLPYKY